MNKGNTKFIILLSVVIVIFSLYNSSQDVKLSESSNTIQLLEKRLEKVRIEIKDLKENTDVYETYQNLTDLSSYESFKFEQFRQDYDIEVLAELKPVSILRMYLYAKLIEDYETQFELFTTNEEYVLMTKEEFLANSQSGTPSEMDIFEDVYELKISLSESNEEHAYISWKSKNGYIDERAGAFIYGFALQKDDNIWKVSFNPMN